MSDSVLRSPEPERDLPRVGRVTAARSLAGGGAYPSPGEPAISRSDKTATRSSAALPLPSAHGESPLVRHNQLGESYTVKLVYPGFYLGMTPRELTNVIGFPLTKEKLAKKVQPGHFFFIYVTSPERCIIGMGQAGGHAVFSPETDYKRPWIVELVWVIGPKAPGVRFADIGLQVRARVGDTTYAITDEVAAAIIDRLQGMGSLTSADLARQKERYRMFA